MWVCFFGNAVHFFGADHKMLSVPQLAHSMTSQPCNWSVMTECVSLVRALVLLSQQEAASNHLDSSGIIWVCDFVSDVYVCAHVIVSVQLCVRRALVWLCLCVILCMCMIVCVRARVVLSVHLCVRASVCVCVCV